MDKVILMDDVIKPNSIDGKKINEILGKDYELEFINTKKGIESLLQDVSSNLKLVLLDLDLSKIQIKAEDVLEKLIKKGLKVIILTVIPPTYESREKKKKGWLKFAYPQKLLYRGALGYLSKTDIDQRPIFFKNCIDSIINDYHKKYKLILDCKLARLQIVDSSGTILQEKDLSSAREKWRFAESPESPPEAVLRILYEMGRQKTLIVKLQDEYYKKLKKIVGFGDYLNAFNYSIKEKAEGSFPVRLLEGPGQGKRTGIYKANIGAIELINDEVEEATASWREAMENRLTKIEECLQQLLQQSKKE